MRGVLTGSDRLCKPSRYVIWIHLQIYNRQFWFANGSALPCCGCYLTLAAASALLNCRPKWSLGGCSIVTLWDSEGHNWAGSLLNTCHPLFRVSTPHPVPQDEDGSVPTSVRLHGAMLASGARESSSRALHGFALPGISTAPSAFPEHDEHPSPSSSCVSRLRQGPRRARGVPAACPSPPVEPRVSLSG